MKIVPTTAFIPREATAFLSANVERLAGGKEQAASEESGSDRGDSLEARLDPEHVTARRVERLQPVSSFYTPPNTGMTRIGPADFQSNALIG